MLMLINVQFTVCKEDFNKDEYLFTKMWFKHSFTFEKHSLSTDRVSE